MDPDVGSGYTDVILREVANRLADDLHDGIVLLCCSNNPIFVFTSTVLQLVDWRWIQKGYESALPGLVLHEGL